jgi:phospholipid transport system substrate-binding protein
MYGEFQRIFAALCGRADHRALRARARTRAASAQQLAAFTDAFAGYMARKYGARFREFIGGQIVVRGARPVQSFIEVQTTAELRGQAPFAVTFLVSDRSGQPKFFDLLIEGISLLRTERTEIGAMLDRRRRDIDLLIQDLRQAG